MENTSGDQKKVHDLVIVGAGPAGLAAGIYAGRGGLDAVLLDMMGGGGQMNMIDRVENYPGVIGLETGADLAAVMRQQVEQFGLQVSFDQVKQIEVDSDCIRVVGSEVYPTKTLLMACGARHRPLGVAGEGRLMGKGVSVCATCDGNFFKGKPVAVVGGGDSAIMEALYLTRIVSHVTIIHRRDKLRAEKYLQDRIFEATNVDFMYDCVVEEILGDTHVGSLRVRNLKTQQVDTLNVDAVFVFIGLIPNTEILRGIVDMDENGFVITDNRMRTSHPRIFASGDIRADSVRQIGAAVGDGITAVVTAQEIIDLQTPQRTHVRVK